MSYWSATFAGQPACVAEVRRFTAKMLDERPGADVVELVASELASNAVRHSESGRPGGYFTLHLAAFVDCWGVRVDDAGGPNEPQLHSAEADWDETGRGLMMVAALSHRWGVLGDQYGRAVWAEILTPEAAAVAA
jgi:anti-sigma regulatory factor (Ser/Thr protein kinase)